RGRPRRWPVARPGTHWRRSSLPRRAHRVRYRSAMSRSQNMRAMALNDPHQEFPRVTALARRIPNPTVSRAPLLWAILAAFGAALFVGAAVTVLFSLLYRLFSIPSDVLLPAPVQLSAFALAATARSVS